MTIRLAVTLGLALAVLGCVPSPLLGDAGLLTGVPATVGDGCFLNAVEGELVVEWTYGTAITYRDGPETRTTPVAWRPGYSARSVGSEVAVIDPQGNVVATTGQRYRIDGGYAGGGSDWPEMPRRVFWACDRVTPVP